MLHCFVRYVVTEVSKDRSDSIFRVKQSKVFLLECLALAKNAVQFLENEKKYLSIDKSNTAGPWNSLEYRGKNPKCQQLLSVSHNI
jgi:hypothetical protein